MATNANTIQNTVPFPVQMRTIPSITVNGTFQVADTVTGTGGANYGQSNEFKVTKRVAPTMTLYAAVSGTSGAIRNIGGASNLAASTAVVGSNRFLMNTGSTAAATTYEFYWTANAEL